MDKVIATALLTISAVIAAAMVATNAFPMLTRSTDAMAMASASVESRIKTNINVIHASGDQDLGELYIWVKNIGSITVDAVTQSDLFLQTPGGQYDRIPYGSGTGQWQFSLQGSSTWSPGATIKVTVSLASVDTGEYRATLVTPNGIGTQTTFSI